MSIKILKLVNGDDVISEVEKSDKEVTVLKNPAKLLMSFSEFGEMGMGLIPWCPYSDKELFQISSAHIITTIDPPDELRNEYSEQFGYGIVTPPTDLIL